MANSSHTEFEGCLFSIVTKYIFTFWLLVYVFFLPVFLFVLYIGFNKWKKPQSSGGLSHSDVITLNMTSMEMVNIIGSFVALFGYYGSSKMALRVGVNTVFGTMTGQTLFHSLTSVERYLAVVHPVTYLRLKRGGGVIIKNISLGIVCNRRGKRLVQSRPGAHGCSLHKQRLLLGRESHKLPLKTTML
uniref:Uncharacterized protein n=1 Tax=Knipowitschia caucasica TaxID=637954 RepID=A0AAV2KK15_KNICA